jgi:hypothetical protein
MLLLIPCDDPILIPADVQVKVADQETPKSLFAGENFESTPGFWGEPRPEGWGARSRPGPGRPYRVLPPLRRVRPAERIARNKR